MELVVELLTVLIAGTIQPKNTGSVQEQTDGLMPTEKIGVPPVGTRD